MPTAAKGRAKAAPAKPKSQAKGAGPSTKKPARPAQQTASSAKQASASAKKVPATAKKAQASAKTSAPKRRPILDGPDRKGPVLLSGGNPRVAKADGDAPVQAYIAAVPGWKRDVARRLDALITQAVPGVQKAVKWNSPFYGLKGQGWFVSYHVFTNFVKLTFFRGTSLKPPVTGGTGKDARWIDVHEDDLDEAQVTRWVQQAAALPGWGAS